MKPANYNFEITQGDDFLLPLKWQTRVGGVNTPVNITGYHFEWEFVPLDSAIAKFVWKDTGENPVIAITDAAAGEFEVNVPNTVTAAYTFINALHKLNVISPTGKVKTILRGGLKISKDL